MVAGPAVSAIDMALAPPCNNKTQNVTFGLHGNRYMNGAETLAEPRGIYFMNLFLRPGTGFYSKCAKPYNCRLSLWIRHICCCKSFQNGLCCAQLRIYSSEYHEGIPSDLFD